MTNEDRARHWAQVLGKRLLGAVSDDGTTTLWSEHMARVVILNAITDAVAESMKRDAGLICHWCGRMFTRQAVHVDGKWWHSFPIGFGRRTECKAGPIHAEIAKLEKHSLTAHKESGS